jgi:prepilin-type N-terminal cleavage/methylation domain-containing protein
MALRKIFHPDIKGFTLIEIVVTLAILLTILSLGTLMSLDAYRGYAFRSERSLLVSALLRARAEAMNNMGASAHGVCYASVSGVYSYLSFRGTLCDPSSSLNDRREASKTITVTGLSAGSPVVFTQLSGTTTAALIHLSDGVHSADIIINHEGTINW